MDDTTSNEYLPQPFTKPAEISFYGDSRIISGCHYSSTWNSTLNETIAKVGVDYLNLKTGGNYRYRQRGVDTSSLKELVEGIVTNGYQGPFSGSWVAQISQDPSPYIVLAHGTNDSWKFLTGYPGYSASDFEAVLEWAVNTAKTTYNKKVLLVQPYRVCTWGALGSLGASLTAAPNSYVKPYADAVTRVGVKLGVPVVALNDDFPFTCSNPPSPSRLPDGLHADQGTTRFFGSAIGAGLVKLVTP